MASRDPDDILRDVRRSSSFVLVQRRSASSRKPRARLCRNRKSPRVTPGSDADTRPEMDFPGTEWSSAKGKRPWNSGRRGDLDHSPNSRVQPAELRTHPTQPVGQSHPACCTDNTRPQSTPSSQRLSAVVIDKPAVSPRPGYRQNIARDSCVPVVGSRSSPVLKSPVCPQQTCVPWWERRGNSGQETTCANRCTCYHHSRGDVKCLTNAQSQVVVEANRSSVHRRWSGSDTASVVSSRSLWSDWQPSKSCRGSNGVSSSRVCICPHCCPDDQVINNNNVCASRACGRTNALPQKSTFSPWKQFTCDFQRKPLARDHLVVVNVDLVGPDCGEDSKERNKPCTHRCPTCPCLRCQQRRLVSASLTRRALNPPEQSDTFFTKGDHSVHPSQASDPFTDSQSDSESEFSDSRPRPCSQQKSYWTRMMCMRYVGRCLLLLVLISFGGLLAHVTVTDVSGGNDAGVDNTIGAGMVLGGSYQVDLLMKLHMRPVTVKEFQERLRTVRNKFDILRIFLADRNISDESLARLLTASMAPSSFHTFLHSDAMTSPGEDDVQAKLPAASNPGSPIQMVGEDASGPGLPEKESGANSLTQSGKVTRKDGNDSDGSRSIKKRSRKGETRKDIGGSGGSGETRRRDLPKRDTVLSKWANRQKDLPHRGAKSVRSRATAPETPQNKPVNVDVKQFSTVRASPVHNGVSRGASPPAFKGSDIKSDVTEDAPFSGFKASDVGSYASKAKPESSVKGSGDKYDRGREGVQLAAVLKRAEPLDDDYDYSDDEEVDESDYLDGEVEYYNDAARADGMLEEMEEAAHHMAEMESNPHLTCRDPQPQVVRIVDPKGQNRIFYPPCTVIHRCRNDSGCCGLNQECGPKNEQVIFRAFMVVTVNATSSMVSPSSPLVERISLVNHTECHCQEKQRLPDCTQDCPGVFIMRRYGSRCVCDCRSSVNERFPQCVNVKEGRTPLSQSDLECIKEGRCAVPLCSVGQFNVSSGLCPVKDMYSKLVSDPNDRLHRQNRHHEHSRHHKPPPKEPVEGSRPPPSQPAEGSGTPPSETVEGSGTPPSEIVEVSEIPPSDPEEGSGDC